MSRWLASASVAGLTLLIILACAGVGPTDEGPTSSGDPGAASVETPSPPGQGGSMEEAVSYLDRTYEEGLEKYGPVERRGETLEDSSAFRDYYVLAARVADETGLDFVKLASIHRWSGYNGLSRVVERLGDHPGASKAQELIHKARAASGNVDELEALYASLRDPDLSAGPQADAWLDGVLEGLALEHGGTGGREVRSLRRYGYAVTCAELIGLTAEKLATVGMLAGKRRLRTYLETMPDLPEKQACLDAID